MMSSSPEKSTVSGTVSPLAADRATIDAWFQKGIAFTPQGYVKANLANFDKLKAVANALYLFWKPAKLDVLHAIASKCRFAILAFLSLPIAVELYIDSPDDDDDSLDAEYIRDFVFNPKWPAQAYSPASPLHLLLSVDFHPNPDIRKGLKALRDYLLTTAVNDSETLLRKNIAVEAENAELRAKLAFLQNQEPSIDIGCSSCADNFSQVRSLKTEMARLYRKRRASGSVISNAKKSKLN